MTTIDLGRESIYYKDDGCQHSPSCLSCPLPVCVHDDPLIVVKTQRRERALAVYDFSETWGALAAARQFGYTERTIYRIRERVKRGVYTDL